MEDSSEFVSIVIPALDEALALPAVTSRVMGILEETGVRFEILIVDDGSRDDTWAVIKSIGESDPRVGGIRFSRNFGHQAALLSGLRAARGNAVITMDADGEHPPESLPEFVKRWRSGALVVQGIRSGVWQRSWVKRATSRAFYRLLGLVGKTPVLPGTADFRLLDRRAVDCVGELPGQTVFLRGLVPWLGLPTELVRFEVQPRVAGNTSYSISRMFNLSLDGLLTSSALPLRTVALLGLASALASFLFLGYVIAVRFFDGRVIPGWASVAGLLALFGGIQLLALGVVGEYLGRLFDNSLGRPPYVVLETMKAGEDPPFRRGPLT